MILGQALHLASTVYASMVIVGFHLTPLSGREIIHGGTGFSGTPLLSGSIDEVGMCASIQGLRVFTMGYALGGGQARRRLWWVRGLASLAPLRTHIATASLPFVTRQAMCHPIAPLGAVAWLAHGELRQEYDKHRSTYGTSKRSTALQRGALAGNGAVPHLSFLVARRGNSKGILAEKTRQVYRHPNLRNVGPCVVQRGALHGTGAKQSGHSVSTPQSYSNTFLIDLQRVMSEGA